MNSSFKSALQKLGELEEKSTTSSDQPQEEIGWRAAFQWAIKQLSIAVAAEDTQDKGMPLPGREKERAQISNFLRTAIRGLNVEGEEDGDDERKKLKSSLFIAGPL